MTTNTKILFATIAGLVLLCARKAKGAASVGKVERIKRRIYKEVSLAQSSGVDFSKKYDQLTPDEKQALERIGHEFGWKQSKRAIETGKTYTESYYSSLRRAWNAVSGIEGVGRAYNVKDANGNVCLTWIEDAAEHYNAEQRTLEAERRAAAARRKLQATRRSVSGFRRHRAFGGNSGYSGYSMSKRAIEARNDGKYPKTDFRRIYHLTEKSFAALLELGYINNSEWHHTSSYGNRTTFYAWEEPEFPQLYADNKTQIDQLSRNGELEKISIIFGEEEEDETNYGTMEDIRRKRILEDEGLSLFQYYNKYLGQIVQQNKDVLIQLLGGKEFDSLYGTVCVTTIDYLGNPWIYPTKGYESAFDKEYAKQEFISFLIKNNIKLLQK